MDPLTLVAHAIWAAVALCGIGAVLYVWHRSSLKDAERETIMTQGFTLNAHKLALDAIGKEVETIRDGLEKLKAIPPKAPRF